MVFVVWGLETSGDSGESDTNDEEAKGFEILELSPNLVVDPLRFVVGRLGKYSGG